MTICASLCLHEGRDFLRASLQALRDAFPIALVSECAWHGSQGQERMRAHVTTVRGWGGCRFVDLGAGAPACGGGCGAGARVQPLIT